MSNPAVPPYFGSWQQLVNALQHNPFLGSGHGKPHVTHLENLEVTEPDPVPWLISSLIGLVCLKQGASKMPASEQKNALLQGIDSRIIAVLDEYCGTVIGHWHLPGPPTQALADVSTLVFIANTFQDVTIRNELVEISSKVLQGTQVGIKGV